MEDMLKYKNMKEIILFQNNRAHVYIELFSCIYENFYFVQNYF